MNKSKNRNTNNARNNEDFRTKSWGRVFEVPTLLLENHSASVRKEANSNLKNTENFVRTQTVNFRNLIHVSCTKEQKSRFMPMYFCFLNTR